LEALNLRVGYEISDGVIAGFVVEDLEGGLEG
jgi:hypothetical protein